MGDPAVGGEMVSNIGAFGEAGCHKNSQRLQWQTEEDEYTSSEIENEVAVYPKMNDTFW